MNVLQHHPIPLNKVRAGKCAKGEHEKHPEVTLLEKSLLGRKRTLAFLTKCHFSDETQSGGPDPLWSLNPKQERGCQISWPNPKEVKN